MNCVVITEEYNVMIHSMESIGRGQLKCDGTRTETTFCLSTKRTTGSRGVGISGSNAGYTMFRCCVKSSGSPLHSPNVFCYFTCSSVRECGHCRPGQVQFEWLHSQKCTGHNLSCLPHAESCCKRKASLSG